MNTNALLLIVSTFVLLGRTTADPTTPKVRNFLNEIIRKIISVSAKPMEVGIKLIENAYAQKSNHEEVNILLGQIIRDYGNLDPDDPIKTIEMFYRLTFVFGFISSPVDDNLENRDQVEKIKELLEKHNVKEVAKMFEHQMDTFLKWLIIATNVRINKMSLDEQLEVKQFEELCLRFKDEIEPRARMLLILGIIKKLEE